MTATKFRLTFTKMKNGDPKLGIGGAPTRATTLPTDAKSRKEYPVASGCLDYFPDALCAVSNLSKIGNDQHNAGQPLHWARGKSGDEADTMLRHFLQRGTRDTDGVRHSVKMAWRALALLQRELEAEQNEEGLVIGGAPLTFSDGQGYPQQGCPGEATRNARIDGPHPGK
jgi:hypothetical protein